MGKNVQEPEALGLLELRLEVFLGAEEGKLGLKEIAPLWYPGAITLPQKGNVWNVRGYMACRAPKGLYMGFLYFSGP